MKIDKEFEQHFDLPKVHKEFDVEQAIGDVIHAAEDGQVYVALAFLNGMLVAMKMGGKK